MADIAGLRNEVRQNHAALMAHFEKALGQAVRELIRSLQTGEGGAFPLAPYTWLGPTNKTMSLARRH